MTRRRFVLALALLTCGWMLAGILRADAAARDWFARAHGSQATVVDVQVTGVVAAFPPFWQVTISGDVVEAGRATPSYRSSMNVWIEPITGFGFANGSG